MAAVILVATFAIVLVAAGHGVAPIGMLLVIGNFSEWGFPMTLGWVGVLLTFSALFSSQSPYHVRLAGCGLVGLAASWLLLLIASEGRIFTFVTSIPFLAVSTIRGFQLWGI